jgi:hypothetical protein
MAKARPKEEQIEQTIDTAKAEQGITLLRQQSLGLVAELTSAFPGTEITGESDLTLASEALTRITKHLKEWEQKRTEIVQPANNFVRSINQMWARLVDPVKSEDARLRMMMSTFRAKESQRRQQEYQEGLKQVEEVFPGGSPIPDVVAPIPADSLKHVVTQNGTVHYANVRKWEIQDIDKIPREYFILDESRIGKLVKAGIEAIPGIRIWIEQVPVVRGS